MAKFKNGQLTGLIGSVVAVRMKNEQILRSAPRKRSTNSWSDKQKLNWKRFGILIDFWNRFRFTKVQKIWKMADEGGRGINLFIKTNLPAFGPEGELVEPSRLHFSAGKLPLPHSFNAVRNIEDPSKIEVSWDNNPEPGPRRADDELVVMTSKDGYYSGPVSTGVWRRAGSATIQLSPELETAQAVYLSFASEKRGMYSEDRYFGI